MVSIQGIMQVFLELFEHYLDVTYHFTGYDRPTLLCLREGKQNTCRSVWLFPMTASELMRTFRKLPALCRLINLLLFCIISTILDTFPAALWNFLNAMWRGFPGLCRDGQRNILRAVFALIFEAQLQEVDKLLRERQEVHQEPLLRLQAEQKHPTDQEPIPAKQNKSPLKVFFRQLERVHEERVGVVC